MLGHDSGDPSLPVSYLCHLSAVLHPVTQVEGVGGNYEAEKGSEHGEVHPSIVPREVT